MGYMQARNLYNCGDSTEDKLCVKLVSLHAYFEVHGQHNVKFVNRLFFFILFVFAEQFVSDVQIHVM